MKEDVSVPAGPDDNVRRRIAVVGGSATSSARKEKEGESRASKHLSIAVGGGRKGGQLKGEEERNH